MCYEYSSWFRKAHATDLGKAREKADAAKRAPAKDPETAPERERPVQVKEREKVPA
jgi:hypothetical protein